MADEYLVYCEMRSMSVTCGCSPFGNIDISDLICLTHDKQKEIYRISWRDEADSDERTVQGKTMSEVFVKYMAEKLKLA